MVRHGRDRRDQLADERIGERKRFGQTSPDVAGEAFTYQGRNSE